MRCGGRFAITVLCLALVLTLTDWRWLQGDTGANYQAAMLTHNNFYPPSFAHRAKVLRQIETGPPPAELPPGTLVTNQARPNEFNDAPIDPTPISPADRDPLYAFMSLQV